MKRFLSFVLSVILVVSLLPATVFAEDDATYYVAGSTPFFEWGWTTGDERALMNFDGEKYVASFNSDGAYTNVNFKIVECTEQGQNWYGDTDGGNVIFCTTGEGDIVISYDPVSGFIGVSGSAYAPASFAYESVYAVGDGKGSALLNGAVWSPDSAQNLMTEYATDKWTIVYKNVEPTGCFEVKFTVDGSWDVNFGGSFAGFGQDTAAVLNGDNIYFELSAKSDVTLTLDLSQFDISTKQGASFRIDAEPVQEPSNIVSVEVPEFHITQFLDGDRDTGWRENGDGEWEEYDCYRYNVLPPYMKVTFENGDVFEGSYDDFINDDTYGWSVAFTDRQDTGETYDEPGRYESSTLYFYHDELTPTEDDEIIVDYAFYLDGVESISVDNVTKTAYTNGNYTMGGTFDQEGNYTAAPAPWFYHDLYSTMQVTFCGEGGSVLKRCTPNELYIEKGVQGEIRPSQQYGAEYGVGTRELVYSVYGLSCDFELTLTEPEYRLVAVAPVSVYENTNGYFTSYGYYEEEEYKEGEYFRYDLNPATVTVERVATGERFDVDFYSASYYIGHEPYVVEIQSENNVFEAGNSYTVSLYASGSRFEFPFEIKEPSTDTYELVRRVVEEYTHGNYVTTFFDGDPTVYNWFLYNAEPESVIIHHSDGTSETVDFEEFGNDHDIYRDYDGQSYDSPWDVGVHRILYRIDGKECYLEVEIVPNGIESISFTPAEFRTIEGASGHYLPDGNGGMFFYYDFPPVDVTLTFADGHEETYLAWALSDTGYEYRMDSDQRADAPWGVGEHVYSVSIGGKTADLPFIIEENPIESITVDDIVIVENTEMIEVFRYDDEGNQYTYLEYNVQPRMMRVLYKDGHSYYAAPREIEQESGLVIDTYFSDQTYVNTWGLGEHEAKIWIAGFEVTYKVTIVEDPLGSITFDPASYAVDEFTGGYYVTIGDISYFDYIFPDVGITLHFKDGHEETYSNVNDLENAGYSYKVTSNQSQETPWGVGDHVFTLQVNGTTADLPFTVRENPVESIEVDGVTIFEGQNRFLSTWTDQYGVLHQYYYYDVLPSTVRIKFKDGTSFEGTTWLIRQRFGVDVNTTSDQGEGSEWGVGEHTAYLVAFGFRVPYTVTITESPIASIYCDDIVVTEGTHCYTAYENGVGWTRYSVYAERVTVTLKDGTSATYIPHELYDEFGQSVRYTDDQWYGSPWGVGEHKAKITLLGVEYEFKVIIKESPIDRVEYDPIVLEYGADGYYTPYGEFFYYVYEPEFTVYLKNGETVRSEHGRANIDGTWYYAYSYDNQQDSHWTEVGEYDVRFTFAGKETAVKAKIVPSTLKSIEIADEDGVFTIKKYFKNGTDKTYTLENVELMNMSIGKAAFKAHTDNGSFIATASYTESRSGVRHYGDGVALSVGEVKSNTLDFAPTFKAFMINDAVSSALVAYHHRYPEFVSFDPETADVDTVVAIAVSSVMDYNMIDIIYDEETEAEYIIINPEVAKLCVGELFGVEVDATSCSYYDAGSGRLRVPEIWYMGYIGGSALERAGSGYRITYSPENEDDYEVMTIDLDSRAYVKSVSFGDAVDTSVVSIEISEDEKVHLVATLANGDKAEADIERYAPKFFGNGYFDATLFTTAGPVDARVNYTMTENGVAKFACGVSVTVDGVTSNALEYSRFFKLQNARGILLFTLIAIKDHEADFEGFDVTGEYDAHTLAAIAVKACVDYYHVGTVVEGDEFDTVTLPIATVREAVEYIFGIKDFTMDTDGGNVTFELYHSEMYFEDCKVEKTADGWTVTCEPEGDYGFDSVTITFDGDVNAKSASFETADFIPGDVNGDGDVTVKDVLLMRRYIAGLDELTEEQIRRGDMNGDGDITSKDVLKARRFIAGLD